ncbi:hypothetical protein LCGC14_0264010 [marine sediment metagenome]|uniref:Uncharacterized protein n=1 Tax=marine sediment metagenome TaxID=412755 RepID=A0A0F9UHN5_9ZZZZ
MGTVLLNEEKTNRTDFRGAASELLAAGQFLKIETTPAGVEMLNAQVPVGKKWTIRVWVNIVETDV